MHPYTDNEVFADPVDIPDDADPPRAAEVNVPLEALLDRARFLYNRSFPIASLTALAAIATPTDGLVRHVRGFGEYLFDSGATAALSPFSIAAADATPGAWIAQIARQQTLTRMLGAAECGPIYVTGAFVAAAYNANTVWFPVVTFIGTETIDTLEMNGPGIGNARLEKVDTGSNRFGYFFSITDKLVDGATLASASMKFSAFSSGRGGSLPTLMPMFGVVRYDASNTPAALLSTPASGLVTDGSASVAAFEATHDVVFTPDQNNVIDKSQYGYGIMVWTEGGTGAIAHDTVLSFSLAMTNIPDARRS